MAKEVYCVKLSDSMVTGFGWGTECCMQAMLDGKSALQTYSASKELPIEYTASRVVRDLGKVEKYQAFSSSFWTKVCLWAIDEALKGLDLNMKSDRVVVILSTTKGDMDKGPQDMQGEYSPVGILRAIERYYGKGNNGLVVSNACISGLAAQLEAKQMLESGRYDYAVVVGMDGLSDFILSGFHCLKAMDINPCRSFDMDRQGMNPGEAVGVIVYGRRGGEEVEANQWVLSSGAIRNDANHISGPSRTGEGLWRAIEASMRAINMKADDLHCLNMHGSGTIYSDNMESIALERAGLRHLPVTAFKGYFGHCFGAAGIIESIAMMHGLDKGMLLPILGYKNCGTEYPLNIVQKVQESTASCFMKTLSGFGGVNAAAIFQKAQDL